MIMPETYVVMVHTECPSDVSLLWRPLTRERATELADTLIAKVQGAAAGIPGCGDPDCEACRAAKRSLADQLSADKPKIIEAFLARSAGYRRAHARAAAMLAIYALVVLNSVAAVWALAILLVRP